MLRNIPTNLSPSLLACLAEMGHGDEIAIVDANFPAQSHAQRCIRLAGVNATDALISVLQLLPVDTFVEDSAVTMAVVDDPQHVPEIVGEFQEIINRDADVPAVICSIERFDFYNRAKKAYAIVQTSELRLYRNIILNKGVISP